jgi:hypothetical protein
MAITTTKLWMATDSNRLLNSPTSFTPAQTPTFYQGNVSRVELHILSGAGVGAVPYEVPFPPGATIQLAVGDLNAYPTAGTWKLLVNSNETAALPFNATASAVSVALNALSDVTSNGGVSVSKAGNAYVVTWLTYGTKPAITAGPDTLTPASYQAISFVQAGGVSTNEVLLVELRQNPIALASDFTQIVSPAITVTNITTWNGVNKIIRFGIEPDPKAGSYILNIDDGTEVFKLSFNFNESVTNIAQSVNEIIEGSTAYQTGAFQFDIVFTEDVTMTATNAGLIGYDGYVGNVSFNTTEVNQFLDGAARKSTYLEVTIEGDVSQTLIQTQCQIASDIIASGVNSPITMPGGLSETVANNRFVRRDVAQSPDAPTQTIIWGNLGVPRPPADGSYHIFKDNVWETVNIF